MRVRRSPEAALVEPDRPNASMSGLSCRAFASYRCLRAKRTQDRNVSFVAMSCLRPVYVLYSVKSADKKMV